jgi:cell division topological specificity factor
MFGWFNKNESARVAKDRLTVAIMTDRATNSEYPFMNELKVEIVEVVKKYIGIKEVVIKKEVDEEVEALSIEIQLDK